MVCPLLSTKHGEVQLIGDHVIFFGKDFVGREKGSGSVVEQTQQEDVALRVLDAGVELLAVVVDADELDEELLDQQHEGTD